MLTVREALERELDEAGRLCVDAYRQYRGDVSPEAWAFYERDLADTRGRAAAGTVVVAEREGRLVGTASLSGPGDVHGPRAGALRAHGAHAAGGHERDRAGRAPAHVPGGAVSSLTS